MKAVVRQTGLSADAIRVWEKRYGAVSPERNAAGRRIYKATEVQRLKLLATLVRGGRPIGNVAKLTDDELIVEAASHTTMNSVESSLEKHISALLRSLKECQFEILRLMIKRILFEISPKDFVFYLIPNIMNRIQKLQEMGEISIYQEHSLSELFATLLRRIFDDLLVIDNMQSEKRETLLLGLPEGEYHEFGLQIAGIICRLKGFNTIYLGANLPLQSLCEAASILKPKAILISITNLPTELIKMPAAKYMKHLLRHISPSSSLWVGGSRSHELSVLGFQKNLRVFESILDFERKLDSL